MTVESVQYINDLEPARPQGGDSIAQGDDHIRNIKKGIKNTFKNIEGEVNASQDELNTLVGIDTSKPLKDQLTDGAGDLQDQITILDGQINDPDTGLAKQVSDNTASITQLSGRVSDLERDLPDVAAMVTNQKIGDHADVDITTLEAGMALVWDGTNWVAQKVSGGGAGMITLVQQPRDAGEFGASGELEYSTRVLVGNGITKTLAVPAGKVFCFEYFYGTSSSGTLRISPDDVFIDGVQVYNFSVGSIDYTSAGGDKWPNGDRSVIVRVEDKIEFRNINCYSAEGRLHVAGTFIEA